MRQWRTKSGELLNVSEMTEQHINHTLGYLERKSLAARALSVCDNDEMPDSFANNFGCIARKMEEWIDIFKDELTKRSKTNDK